MTPARAARRLVAALVALLLGGGAAPALGAESAVGPQSRSASAITAPPSLTIPPRGYERTGGEVSRVAGRVPKIVAARRGRAGTYARPYLKGPPSLRRWQVSFYEPTPGSNAEIGQVIVDDRTGRVLEAWTGFQVEWTMARGYPGAFGRRANAPYVWLTLCVLFVLPFLRRPLRLLHLDVAVLLAFSASYAFFQAAEVDVSVPTTYPLLGYLLLRLLFSAVARARGRSPSDRPPLALAVPYSFLVIATIFLIGFRVGLNVTDGNVIDVGYAGVIGADRLLEGREIYGTFPSDNGRGDTYGPVNYYAYVPFAAAWPWSGTWDDLPAAHGAAVAFDLACLLLMFLVGRRIRGPGLGILLAYLWATYPFTLLVSNSSANDSLVAALVLLVLLVVSRPAGRGAAAALAGLTKFAPLGLVPLLATYGGGGKAGEWGYAWPARGGRLAGAAPAGERGADGDGGAGRRAGFRVVVLTALGLAVGAAVLMAPVLLGGDIERFYERTLAFQNDRGSPFSVWGLYDLPGAQTVAKLAAAALALAVAFWPRRRDPVVVAALGGAVLIALQIAVTHWFYLYLVWFLPLVLVALLAPHREPEPFPRIL